MVGQRYPEVFTYETLSTKEHKRKDSYMDQPTNLKITITGKVEDVKRAALTSQRRIDLDTRGFVESAYIFGDGSDFKEKMDNAIVIGSCEFNEFEDGKAEYSTEQDSYGCIYEDDIKEIANDIRKVSPNVEFHIEAVITITYEEGYDLCVDIEHVGGKLTVDTSEWFYDDDDEEEEDYEDNNKDYE